MKFYVLRLVDWLPNAVRQTNQQIITLSAARQLVKCHVNEVTL
jgi:hypothetical protein